MTKVGRLIIEREEEAIRRDEERIARNMLAEGDSVEKVSRNTGLELSDVQRLADQLQGNLATA